MSQQAFKPAADATYIEGFSHVPGRHCGSTALANLLRRYGLDLPEEVVFGLAAGAAFFYVELPDMSPSRIINGRAAKLEEQFIDLAKGALVLEKDEDPSGSWQIAKRRIDSGDPVILLTDLYYLDHYDNSAHFPGHAVVLAGYDSESAYLADTDFEDLVSVPLESLSKARHSQAPPFPLAGEAISVPDPASIAELEERLPELSRKAIELAATNMINPPFGEHQGVPALRKLATEVASWPNEADDWKWCARFGYQVIERRGTGGGNFRKIYSEFLSYVDGLGIEGAKEASVLCAAAAEKWTALSRDFKTASKSEDKDVWDRLAEQSADLASREERLWTGLLAI